jgi:hypothetical protein
MYRMRSIAVAVLLISSIVFAQGLGADAEAAGDRVDAGTTKPTTTPAEAAEIKAVKEAAKGFATALFGEDFEPVRAVFGGTKEDLEMMRAMQDALKADRAVHAAINKKFPAAGGDDRRGTLMSLEDMKMLIDKADVPLAGDTTGVEEFVLKKSHGKWKVTGLNDWDKMQAAVYCPGIIKGSNEVLAGLEKGQYKTRDEARDALGKAVGEGIDAAKASAEAAQRSTTRPATNANGASPQQP